MSMAWRDEYLNPRRITANIRERNRQGFATVARRHPPIATSERGLLVHRVRGVRLDWSEPGRLSATLAVYECGDATFYPQFFQRLPSKRHRPFLRRCKTCFGVREPAA